MGNNVVNCGNACSHVDDPDDYDPTLIRQFAVWILIFGSIGFALGAVAWREYFPYGAWWGHIFSVVSEWVADL